MRELNVTIVAMHKEKDDRQLFAALASFVKTLHSLGYTTVSAEHTDAEWEEPVEETKAADVPEAKPEPPPEPQPKPPQKSKPLIYPEDYTVEELNSGLLDGYIRRQLHSLHGREMKGKARDGAVAAIKDAIDKL